MRSLFFPRHLSACGAFAALLALGATTLAQAPPPSAAQAPPPSAAQAAPSNDRSNDAIDVRVEGDRAAAPRASRDPNVASYVLRGEDLRRPGASAVDVLLASPGVEPSRSGAGSDLATLSIRGAPSAELPVYLAGIRLNDDVTGAADLSTIPLFALDRAEIYRGNAPPDADRLGIGGAIFFEPRLPRGTHAGLSGGFGSFGELTFEAHASFGDARGGALFAFRQSSAKNDFTFTDDRGTRDPRDDRTVTRANGDADTFDAWALGRVALPGGGRLVLLASTFAREQGVVGTTNLPAAFARSATQREIAAASARLPCASSAPDGATAPADPQASTTGATGAALAHAPAIERCAIEMATSVIASRRDIHDPYGELGFLSTRVQTSGERWEQKLGVQARIGDRWRAGARAFVETDRLDVDIQDGLRTRSARLSVTGSADAAYDPIDRVEIFALAGGECHTAFGGGSAGVCSSGGPAGRVGLRVLAPFGFEALASGGSYLRVPSLGELYGLSATVQGNPELVPERDYSAEAGVRWAGATASGAARAYVDATGFGRFAENLIAYRRTSTSAIAPFNVASARILGVELTAGLELFHHVRAQVSLTAMDPRNTTPCLIPGATGLLPFHAPFTSASLLELYADLGDARFVNRVGLAARFVYRSERYADAAESVYLRDQRDLGLDASAFFIRRRVVARASITNLFDVTSGDLLGFPLPGRAYHASLALSLL